MAQFQSGNCSKMSIILPRIQMQFFKQLISFFTNKKASLEMRQTGSTYLYALELWIELSFFFSGKTPASDSLPGYCSTTVWVNSSLSSNGVLWGLWRFFGIMTHTHTPPL